MADIILYDYWRSSASYRVRIALNLKGLSYEQRPVHLVTGGQRDQSYMTLNPQGLVPTLVHGDVQLTQSMAIIEYLDELYPENPLLPAAPEVRAVVRGMAQVIACDTHPVNNLRVLNYLTGELQQTDEQKIIWMHHWMHLGFQALEQLVASHNGGDFCFGNSPTMADLCLIPQLYNAERFGCDLSPYRKLMKINKNCAKIKVFDKARPENQPDANA